MLAEAFGGLLTLAGDDAVPFVVERMAARGDDVARAAALALAEARRPDAVAALRERLPGEARPDVKHAIILALAHHAMTGPSKPCSSWSRAGPRRTRRQRPTRCAFTTTT